MSSSVLSNNNCCGPVTGLLGKQNFLHHAAQPQPKTISPPLWRTFYAPPTPTTTPTTTTTTLADDENYLNGTGIVVSLSPALTSPLSPPNRSQPPTTPHKGNNNNNIQILPGNFPNQRMTLQKLPNSIIEHTTQGAAVIQKSAIMSVSKLVRPTPKSQHTHHQQQQQQHHQHVTILQQQQQHQLNSAYNTEVQSGPMNLATNSQSSDTSRSRPSSTSSVDIESDDIPESQQQQQQQQQQQHHQQAIIGGVVSSSHQVPTIPAAYQLNYNHLYANKSGYHSNAAAAAADTLRLHASYSYAAIAAVAAAATASASASSFPINAMSPTSLSHHQTTPSTAAHLSLPSPLSLNSTVTTTNALSINASSRLTDHHHHHHQQQQQQQQHQQHQQEQKQRINVNEHVYSPPLLGALPTALSNGTYINCKSSPASDAESSTENYFKVPNTSGKEGSLKHRILTRPASITDQKEEKPTKNAVISTYNSTANFKKGSYIELANGVLRRVEDMRTEDFIQCAERSVHLQLAESTVVKIDATKPQMVMITFSYNRNRSKADIDVSVDHPFFVYGQGWASCDPEKSHKAFGLKCQRLQVGDICISLTQRITPATTAIKTEVTSKETECLPYAKTELLQNCDAITVPLSIKSEIQTVMPPPLSSQVQMQYQQQNNNNIIHRVPPPTAAPMHFIPCHLPTTSLAHHHAHQITYPDFPDLVAAAAAAAAYNSGAHLHHMPTVMPPPPSPDAINGFYQQTQQLFLQGKVSAADLRLQPPTTSTGALSYCPTRTSLLPAPPQSPMLEHAQEQPFDASIASRKRRWSAPEGDFDDVEHRRDHCQNAKLYKAVMAPVTT